MVIAVILNLLPVSLAEGVKAATEEPGSLLTPHNTRLSHGYLDMRMGANQCSCYASKRD